MKGQGLNRFLFVSVLIVTIFSRMAILEANAGIITIKKEEITAGFSDHHYEVFDGKASTWELACQYCESLGGHLATITSQEENDYVFHIMKDAGFTGAYFGLSDREQPDHWKWVTDEPTSYLNWNKAEPNGANEHYGMFYFMYGNGTWNDGDFSLGKDGGGRTFICEWDSEIAYSKYKRNNPSSTQDAKKAEKLEKHSESSNSTDSATIALDADAWEPIYNWDNKVQFNKENGILVIRNPEHSIGMLAQTVPVKKNTSLPINLLKRAIASVKIISYVLPI